MSWRGAWLFAATTLVAGDFASAIILYDNTVNDTGQEHLLSGNIWADDLHMVSGGLVSEVHFGYVANGSTIATICFYTNTATDSIWPGGDPNLGQDAQLLFLEEVPIDPTGSGLGTMTIEPPIVLPQHVWYSIKFNNFNGEVPLYDPPEVGTSDDIMLMGDGGAWKPDEMPRSFNTPGFNNLEVRIGFVIPAPGSMGLIGASVLLFGGRRRRR